ncbi:ribonuclease H [Aspergillus flavus]|uniref:ribonuclease H n=1 Tax=Aspergillus flavus TaxID=5059 RepID=A0AB74CL08_ASPFL|nr:ribonuclease H [Aspergillus flavus]RAQ45939.1 ribonuclease H [Aspergillus flavus]RMZ46908.1 ribonuclease H [Aspergillus flavus]
MTNATPSPPPGPATKPSPSVQSTPTSTAGTKRKRGSAGKYYAVKAGYQPGVYYAWNDCLTQVTGYKGAVFQAFSTLEEANAFLTGSKLPPAPGATASSTEPSRFYGIQRGRVPGVYTDWAKAQEQIKGFARPRYKKFSTKEEAEAFVKLGQANGASFAGNTSEIQKLPGAPGILSDVPKDEQGSPIEPGDGPLPPGAEDGFDPNVLLDPKSGKVVYKTKEQKSVTKTKATGPPGMLRIYTDGSSLKNGRALASAGVGVYFGPGDNSRNVSEPLKGSRQTNQRAELTAILRALDIAPRHRDVTIFTDSQYAIKCVTVWYVKWQRNKWLTSDNKPVENKDLVESIRVKIEERDELKVKTLFEWVKGHNSDPGNEAADRLAVNGAQRGVSEKAAAMEAAKNIPDEIFDDDI